MRYARYKVVVHPQVVCAGRCGVRKPDTGCRRRAAGAGVPDSGNLVVIYLRQVAERFDKDTVYGGGYSNIANEVVKYFNAALVSGPDTVSLCG